MMNEAENMKPTKKPNRFTMEARRELATIWELNEPRLAMLFSRQHAAMMRLVKKQMAEYQGLAIDAVKAKLSPECWDMRVEACLDILKAMKAYKDGMR